MPDRKVDYLLIGGGLASANCARWLREEGAEGTIALVGREPDPPYNRPECSKGYLRGEEQREEAYFRPTEWWSQQHVELLLRTSVTSLDLDARTAKLSSKEEVEFGAALLATGANVRRLNVEGCHLEQIHYLRTLGNADAIPRGDRGRGGGRPDRRLLHRLRGRRLGEQARQTRDDRDAGAPHAAAQLWRERGALLRRAARIARRDRARRGRARALRRLRARRARRHARRSRAAGRSGS